MQTFLLILLSVTLSSGAQILLKMGASSDEVQAALANGPVPAMIAFASNPWIVGGLMIFGLSAISWLVVLSRAPVSMAYPSVALGMVLTVAAGHYLLGEAVSALRLLGLSLIVVGVFVVAAG